MMFFIGLHDPAYAWPFKRSMISINRIWDRKSRFKVNDWIMDSGAFTQINTRGLWTEPVSKYAEQINRWSQCGNLLAAVAQDVMCEPFILAKTGLTVQDHQRITVERYAELIELTEIYVMPVLQGYEPEDYMSHVDQYGSLLFPNQWVGVGSVCKRNGNPDAVEDVLSAIHYLRPDLKLHGFGLKIQALERQTVRALLHSSDSMAWSTAGRKQESDPNDPRRALAYAAQVEGLIQQPVFIQEQLFKWWN